MVISAEVTTHLLNFGESLRVRVLCLIRDSTFKEKGRRRH